MNGRVKAEINREAALAQSLLRKSFGIMIKPLKLYIGDKYQRRFFDFASLRGLAEALLTQGAYDSETNGLYVPSSMAETKNTRKRIFMIVHEYVHAFVLMNNSEFRYDNILRLIRDKSRIEQEKGYIYIVFDEGLATYLGILACLRSADDGLIEEARTSQKILERFFEEWTSFSEPHLKLLAQVHHLKETDWRPVIRQYLLQEPAITEHYKYNLGYYFLKTLQPAMPMICQMIKNPPSTIEHIIYPEKYMAALKT